MKTTENTHVEHQRERVAGEEAADVLQLAHARHRVADAARLEVGQRQLQQVAEQPRAELDVDAAGGVAEDVGAQAVEHALEHARPRAGRSTSTSSVVRPRCTSTLSITTWKNSGLTSANSCRNSETSSTSPSSRRYLTRLGMNQVKSNLASSPARLARLAMRMSSPVHCCGEDLQRLDRGAAGPGDRIDPGTARAGRRTGRGSRARRCLRRLHQRQRGQRRQLRRSSVVRQSLALRPSCLAARSTMVVSTAIAGTETQLMRQG